MRSCGYSVWPRRVESANRLRPLAAPRARDLGLYGADRRGTNRRAPPRSLADASRSSFTRSNAMPHDFDQRRTSRGTPCRLARGSACVATVSKCHRRRQFRSVTGRYGAAVGAAETSHIAAAPTAAAELALFAAEPPAVPPVPTSVCYVFARQTAARNLSVKLLKLLARPTGFRTCGLCLRRAAAWPDRR